MGNIVYTKLGGHVPTRRSAYIVKENMSQHTQNYHKNKVQRLDVNNGRQGHILELSILLIFYLQPMQTTCENHFTYNLL